MNSGEQFLLSNLQFFLRARLIPPVSFSCLLHTEDFCLVSFFFFQAATIQFIPWIFQDRSCTRTQPSIPYCIGRRPPGPSILLMFYGISLQSFSPTRIGDTVLFTVSTQANINFHISYLSPQ